MSKEKYSPGDIGMFGGISLNKHHSRDQIAKDVAFVSKILPAHYIVCESNKPGSIHCKSPIGIRLSPYVNQSTATRVTDAEDEEMWGYIMKALKQHFGARFQEVNHNTCFCHVDFTIYLKPLPNEQ